MHPLEAARAILPAWVVWGPVYTYVPLVFVWALGLTAAGASLGGLPQARQPTDEKPDDWVARARLSYPARYGSSLLAVLLPLFSAMLAWLFGGYLLPIGATGLAALAFVSAWLGSALVRYRVERRILGALTLRVFIASTAVRWLFFLWPLLLILVANMATDNAFTLRSTLVLTTAGLIFGALSLGASIRLGRWLGLVRPADAKLEAIAERVSAAVGHAPSSVWIANTGLANAWILFVGRELVWTSRAVEVLNDDELAAVTAHELGHLSESKGITRARILRLLLFFPLCALRPIAGEFGAWHATLLVVIFFITVIAVSRLSRRMEGRADEVAHEHEGDEGTYARALEKIYRANQAPAVLRGRGGVHGHLYDRLKAAGVTPSYARPAPPSRWRSSAATIVPLLVGVFGLIFLRIVMVAFVAVEDSQGATHVGAALGGVDHQMLETLAEEADARGALEESDVFFRAADFVLPMQPELPPHTSP